MAEHSPRRGGTTRQPHHWRTDLAGARSTEAIVRAVIARTSGVQSVNDRTESMEPVDLHVLLDDGFEFGVEVKAKGQSYTAAAKSARFIPEAEQFILDEKHLREAYFRGGILITVVWNAPRKRWHVFSWRTLLLCDKVRWVRRAQREIDFEKAKVTIDLRNADLSSEELAGTVLVDLGRLARQQRDATGAWTATR